MGGGGSWVVGYHRKGGEGRGRVRRKGGGHLTRRGERGGEVGEECRASGEERRKSGGKGEGWPVIVSARWLVR